MARNRRKAALNHGKAVQRSVLQPLPDCSSSDLPGSPRSVPVSPERSHCAPHVFDVLPQLSADCSVTLGAADTASSDPSSSIPAASADPPSSTPWRNLFTHNRSASAGVQLSQLDTGASCSITADDVCTIEDTWGPTLIGYMAGRCPGKKALQNCCSHWPVPTQFSIHHSGWLLFRFNSISDLQQVLDGGPYFVFNRPLLLKAIPSFFRFETDEV